ncbi:hypothetical protein [Antiquaquibacter soli]|uniref:Uncharacterized protein n=1 Tax=Antiquaquibacter soli TaxID=3064523 RepID=A0ABT9BL72_9MICO|nr:hypothetical protein [Protaetiibacter sp. WY-16]MDO7881760.1 hypothetical protein [Protaetiibacter sp. WY-16]
MTDTDYTEASEVEAALVPRLRLIEDQPLDARAASFAQIHDELRARLEGGDAPSRD